MAGMTTTLTQFSTLGDSRTWTTSGHTAVKPKLVIQKRKVPTGNQTVQESTLTCLQAAIGSDDAVLSSKVSFGATCRIPLNIKSGETTVADALAIFRDMVAGDEFAAMVTGQGFVKP